MTRRIRPMLLVIAALHPTNQQELAWMHFPEPRWAGLTYTDCFDNHFMLTRSKARELANSCSRSESEEAELKGAQET
jgi:hypothetical protein